MNLVRKIKIVIINTNDEMQNLSEEERKDLISERYKFIRDSQYAQFRGLNFAMGYLTNNLLSNNFDYKCDKYKETFNALKNTNPIFNNIEFGKGIDSKSAIINRVKKDFKNSMKGVLRGETSIINYKRTYPLLTRGRSLKVYYEDDKNDTILVKWVNGILFKVIIGYKKNSVELKHTLHKVITGEYTIAESSLEFNKRNDLILNLNLNVPENKIEFEEGRVLGVDLGMAIPVYMALNDAPYVREGLGSYEEFAKVRLQFKARRRRLSSQLKLAKGGKGRKRKLHSLEYLKDKERNFAKTYNHQLSKKIVEFAIKNKVEFIHLEKINSRGINDRVLGLWGYYQLQEQIIYKAKEVGIKVKFIDPKYTSQKCSKCGYVHKDNRISQAKFTCLNCDNSINADWNSAINIAQSTDFVKND